MIFGAKVSKVKHFTTALFESDVVSDKIVAFCNSLSASRRNLKVLVLLETGEFIPDVLADIWNGATTQAVGFHRAIFSEPENRRCVELFATNHVSTYLFDII
jgi:hypothetical protein